MEELKKVNITTEGLANANSPLSKQIEEIKTELIRIGEKIIEEAKPVIKAVAEVAKNTYDVIKEEYKTNQEVKKCYGIYKRTKNSRIRKKQITRIRKIIERRYIKNGNMDKDAE